MDFQTFALKWIEREYLKKLDMQTVGTFIPSGFTLYVGPVNEAQVFAQWNDVYEFTYETKSGLATAGLRITRDPVLPCCL